MLDELKDVLDGIESVDSWAFNFIEKILIQKEENPKTPLSPKQFSKLQELHQKYCTAGSMGVKHR